MNFTFFCAGIISYPAKRAGNTHKIIFYDTKPTMVPLHDRFGFTGCNFERPQVNLSTSEEPF